MDLESREMPKDFDEKALATKAEVLYYKAIDVGASQKRAKQEREDEKIREHERAMEKMTKSTPAELFQHAVDERVRKTLQDAKNKGGASAKGNGNCGKIPPGLNVDTSGIIIIAARGKGSSRRMR